MPKISLTVKVDQVTLSSVSMSEKIQHNRIRLLGDAIFLQKKKKSLSKPHTGIIDTGAPISVIPYSIWKNLHVKT